MRTKSVVLLVVILLFFGVSEVSTGLLHRGELDSRVVAEIMQHKNPLLSRHEAKRIGAAVMRYSDEYAIDPEVVTAIILVESGARPWVESPKGAIGLMQVMPYMVARRRDVFNQPIAGSLTTVETNIEMGCWILSDNIRRRGEEDGISMYFWGNNIQGVGYLDRVSAARRHIRSFVGEA